MSFFFLASGGAIWGTQRYLAIIFAGYSQTSLDEGFQKNLAASEPNGETGRNLRPQIQENDDFFKKKKKKKKRMIVP